MYSKEFDVRWSDLDANRHMANSAYQNYMSHTRMAFLIENGFGHEEMERFKTGPVLFSEQIYYFREIHPGNPITVTAEITGLSEDQTFFSFKHEFYDHNGFNLARGLMSGAWMNLSSRKIEKLPQELSKLIMEIPKSSTFTTLNRENIRLNGQKPANLVNTR